MQQSVGACMYCGQTQMIDHTENITAEELDRKATRRCKCDSAVKARIAEMNKKTATDNIDSLFGTDYPEVAAVLKASVMALISGEAKKVSVDTGVGVKAELAATAKKGIKVKCMENKESVLEG